MTTKRTIYYRRKGKKIIAEGQTVYYGKKKTVYLFTVPPIEKVLKSSLFSPEKTQEILEKITRLTKPARSAQNSSHNQDYTNHDGKENYDGQGGEK
jgi:hypothetical protein